MLSYLHRIYYVTPHLLNYIRYLLYFRTRGNIAEEKICLQNQILSVCAILNIIMNDIVKGIA
jgi:hypothetical protein